LAPTIFAFRSFTTVADSIAVSSGFGFSSSSSNAVSPAAFQAAATTAVAAVALNKGI